MASGYLWKTLGDTRSFGLGVWEGIWIVVCCRIAWGRRMSKLWCESDFTWFAGTYICSGILAWFCEVLDEEVV